MLDAGPLLFFFLSSNHRLQVASLRQTLPHKSENNSKTMPKSSKQKTYDGHLVTKPVLGLNNIINKPKTEKLKQGWKTCLFTWNYETMFNFNGPSRKTFTKNARITRFRRLWYQNEALSSLVNLVLLVPSYLPPAKQQGVQKSGIFPIVNSSPGPQNNSNVHIKIWSRANVPILAPLVPDVL